MFGRQIILTIGGEHKTTMGIKSEDWGKLQIPKNQNLCVRHVSGGILEFIITEHIYKEEFTLYKVEDDMSLVKVETSRLPSFKALKSRKK